MPYLDSDIDSGVIVTPGTGSSQSNPNGPYYIDDTTQQQLDEINNGLVVGSDSYTQVTEILEPLVPNETIYRKRLVKVTDGKIVMERIVYMQRYMISASGGFGDSYKLLQPSIENGEIVFTPIELTLN